MRAVFGLVLVVGMALAGAAVYMIQDYIAQTEDAYLRQKAFNEKAGKLVEVYVFNKSLNYGDALTKEDVQLIYWPERSLPETIFREEALLFPENADGPRYIMRRTEAYEPVLASRVTEPGQLAGLTSKLEKGMRAFAIRVGSASGVSQFIQPDQYVDITWTGTASNGESFSRTIERSILIIAVDDAFNEGQFEAGTEARTVTVAATPEQVARLTQAQASGALSLSLVGDTAEDTVTETVEVDTDMLLGIEEVAPVEVAPVVEEEVCTRKERKGTEVIETPVPCAN